MNITQEIADANLNSWKNLGAAERDKIIYDALFSGELGESTPMFSHNNQNTNATNKLISKLAERGVAGLVKNSPPRSTLCSLSACGIALPTMPFHKAVAYLGYLCAVGEPVVMPDNVVPLR